MDVVAAVAAVACDSAGVVVTAGIAAAEAGFSGSIWPCIAAFAGFDASTVDVLVAIAAAAIASGCVVSPDDVAGTMTAIVTTGVASATATGAGVTTGDAAGCDGAAGSAEVAMSNVAVRSAATSLTVAFTIPDFADPDFTGLGAAVASAPVSTVAGCAAPGFASFEEAVAALEEDVPARGWRLSDAAGVSSGRGCDDGRSGAVTAGRSLLAVPAALLSISAEKLSGVGDGSVRADLDGEF
jgi:hypothetical protein